MKDILSGYKTYLGGVILIIIGVLLMNGIVVPGFEGQAGGTVISTGVMFIFTRLGIAKNGTG